MTRTIEEELMTTGLYRVSASDSQIKELIGLLDSCTLILVCSQLLTFLSDYSGKHLNIWGAGRSGHAQGLLAAASRAAAYLCHV